MNQAGNDAIQNPIDGRCFLKVGNDVNTDLIIPGRYLVSIDPIELAKHAFEPMGRETQDALAKSEIIVAGRNFGCGSAREQAASCLVGAGVKIVVAESFARVFFRNAINTGLVAIECPEAVKAADIGSVFRADTANGRLFVDEHEFAFSPYPENLRTILEAGGLIPYLEKTLAAETQD